MVKAGTILRGRAPARACEQALHFCDRASASLRPHGRTRMTHPDVTYCYFRGLGCRTTSDGGLRAARYMQSTRRSTLPGCDGHPAAPEEIGDAIGKSRAVYHVLRRRYTCGILILFRMQIISGATVMFSPTPRVASRPLQGRGKRLRGDGSTTRPRSNGPMIS